MRNDRWSVYVRHGAGGCNGADGRSQGARSDDPNKRESMAIHRLATGTDSVIASLVRTLSSLRRRSSSSSASREAGRPVLLFTCGGGLTQLTPRQGTGTGPRHSKGADRLSPDRNGTRNGMAVSLESQCEANPVRQLRAYPLCLLCESCGSGFDAQRGGGSADLRGRRRGKLQAGLERLDLELARLRVRRRTFGERVPERERAGGSARAGRAGAEGTAGEGEEEGEGAEGAEGGGECVRHGMEERR